MKKVLMMSIAILLVIATFVGCSKDDKKESKETSKNLDKVASITTKEVKENLTKKDWIIVDARQNDAFNGWKLDGVQRGGHIEGAVDFAANWLSVDMKADEKEKKLSDTLKTKGIDKDKQIVLYDANGKDAAAVAAYLKGKGYKNLSLYDVNEWAKDESLPMVQYKNYKEIVPAQVVKQLLDGKKVETFDNAKNVKMVESSWGEEKESYEKGHIPTAYHINTDSFEPPPEWMLDKDASLAKWALANGFKKSDTVIVSSEFQMAAYRLAVVLRYIGVEDVRVLNGGTGAWLAAGYELEKSANK
ncbi:MAG: ynjE, partial [Bacillales bacterium]|nr:ynjE [Bacillales bacterium]